jgi:hypothetical protein
MQNLNGKRVVITGEARGWGSRWSRRSLAAART